MADGMSKTRIKFKVFELDSNAIKEINQKKYGASYRVSALS